MDVLLNEHFEQKKSRSKFNIFHILFNLIPGIAVLFIVFASFIFTSFVINLLGSEAADLK